MWERNIHFEDNADTVHVIARELVGGLPEQDINLPEMLLFNHAQFTPPMGESAAAGQRRLNRESIELKGLQLYVNYSNSRIDSAYPVDKINHINLYQPGMFFISLPGHSLNRQPEQSVPVVAFSGETISATRGAFGNILYDSPHDSEPNQNNLYLVDCLYVTASIGYAKTDIHNDDAALVDTAWKDRLYANDPIIGWVDITDTALPQVAQSGNSSGVVFVDLNLDGTQELYVGRQGDNYTGATDLLLSWNQAR